MAAPTAGGAGTSRTPHLARPAPVRTLRQPITLNVAERSAQFSHPPLSATTQPAAPPAGVSSAQATASVTTLSPVTGLPVKVVGPGGTVSLPQQAGPGKQPPQRGPIASNSSQTQSTPTQPRPPTPPRSQSQTQPRPPVAVQAPSRSDAATLRQSLERRAELARRADKWSDKLMEEPVDRKQFLRALSYFHTNQYIEIEHERHLNGLCAYPMCPNPPAAPYRSTKRFLVSSRQRTITEKEGNSDEAYCGRKCRARSNWVERTLGTEAPWIRGKVTPLELLEDLEERGEVVWGGRRGDVLSWPDRAGKSVGPGGGAVDNVASTVSGENGAAPAPKSPPPKPAEVEAAAVPPSQPMLDVAAPTTAAFPGQAGTGDITDILSALTIVERETPAGVPVPPSLQPQSGPSGSTATTVLVPGTQSPHIQAQPQPQPQPLPQSQTQSQQASKRAASSLVSAPSSLARALMAAAKSLPPGAAMQADPDSDDESASEEEWAKEMGWGEGPEVERLFKEMSEAREMVDGGGEGRA